MAYNDNVVFKTSTTATIDDLFTWNKSTGQITAKTDNIPIVPGTVYFTSDGHIVHDVAQNNRLWMSKNAYSAVYAEDVAETNTDIANAIKYSIHYVEGPTTDTTPGTWTGTINGITELYDGLTIIYVPAVAGKSPTTTLNINGLGAKTCYYSNTSAMTTHYSVGTPILLTYRNNCWRRADYNSNTTYSAMSVAEMRTGTATSERSIRADYLKTFLSTLGGTNLTLTHSNSAPYLQLNHDPSGITAGTYGNNSQQNPSYGGTFNIPYFTVDTQGHITNASVTTVKIPESDNTDYKVRQTSINSNDNNNYRILLSNSANDTSEDSVSKKNANLIYNPTENKLSTGNIKLTGELDVTGNVYLRNQTAVDSLTAGSLIVNGNSTFNNDINLAQGAVKWTSNSLPSVTSANYFLVIDAFANGGATKYITKADAIKSLISSSAIGSSTKPVYWTGSAFSAITSYSGAAALTGTPTAPTAAAGTNTTQIATTEFVTNAVAQGFVANDAMVFKGLIGSNQPITQLPTSGYNAGWTYRVANAGIFAGEYCEVGDLLIAIKDGPASGSSVINTDWGKIEHNIDGAVFRGSGASNSSVGSSTQPVYVNGSGIVTAITGAIANDTTGNAATATVASKLSNTSAIGSSTQPVYFNSSGQPVAVNKYDKQTGKTTDFVPRVGSDGVMEIGKYIDFHNTSEDTSDYIVRITARDSSETNGAGLTLTGTTVGTLFKGNLNGTATKATQDGNGNIITSTYLPLSGGTMTGNLRWNDLTALPSTTTTDYFLTIDTFANGGTTKYITKGNALKSLISSSSIGTSLRPVYWTGSSFSQVNWFPSYCTVDGHNRNNYNYHRIATLSIGGSTWTDRDAVLVIRSRCNTSNYGIVKISGRANNNQGLLDLLAYWLIRSGFEEDSILICRKRETTDTSLGDTQVDVYLKTPIAYPRIYVYMLVGPSHLNGFQLINSEEKDNSVLSYNTSDAENPNVIDINNSDLKGSYEVYIRDKDENGNLLNSFSGYNPNNSNSQTTPTAQSQVYTHIKTALDAGSVRRAKKSSLISTNQNAIVYYTDTTGTFGQKASANGALYATSANGSLQWGTLPMAQGGTGATTAAGARTNLGLGTMATEAANNYIAKSIGTAKGDIIYWSAANTPARLNIGSVGQVLKVSSNGIPVWSNVNITPANILGSSSTAKFWRGDNTWSNLIRDAHSKSLSTFVAIAGSDNAWNKAGNYNFAISNSNNMMVFNIGGTSNDRNAYIQVGHNSPDPYGNITGNLYLNKLGGQVYINENYAARVTSAISGQVMVADGEAGGIKTTGYTINKSVPANAEFTDRYVNSATFADDSTNTAASPVKMTLTRAGSDTATVTANIPKVSNSSAGVVPKGATVSSQTQTTKFLREDGTWAAPSYTVNTNTDEKVKQATSTVNAYRKVLVSGGASYLINDNASERTDSVYQTSGVMVQPSSGKLIANSFETNTIPSNVGLQFRRGQITIQEGTEETLPAGQPFYGNSNRYDLWSYPPTSSAGPSTAVNSESGLVNIMNLRLAFNSTCFKDIFMSPNNHRIYTRSVNNIADSWKLILRSDIEGAGSTTQPVYISNEGIATTITGALENDTTGNAATATQTKFLMNRGGSTVTIQDNIWNHNQTPFNHTNAATVWHQKWKQSGLTYTPVGGDATAITDSGDLVYWLSAGNTSNVLFLNMAIDGMIYAGGGFKGNLNGTATNATQLISNDRMDYGWNGINYFNISTSNQSAAKVNDTPFSSNVWTHILRFNRNDPKGYYTDLAIPFSQNSIYYKRIAAGSLQNSTTNGGWIKVLDQLNYTSYTVTKTGSGASGTWNINISGTATKATQDGNGNNIINTYLTKTAGVTNITWDNTNKKLIKTINNSNSDIVTLYAANLKLNNTAVYNTELEIKNIKIGNGSTSTSTKNVKLEYNETLGTLNFVFS